MSRTRNIRKEIVDSCHSHAKCVDLFLVPSRCSSQVEHKKLKEYANMTYCFPSDTVLFSRNEILWVRDETSFEYPQSSSACMKIRRHYTTIDEKAHLDIWKTSIESTRKNEYGWFQQSFGLMEYGVQRVLDLLEFWIPFQRPSQHHFFLSNIVRRSTSENSLACRGWCKTIRASLLFELGKPVWSRVIPLKPRLHRKGGNKVRRNMEWPHGSYIQAIFSERIFCRVTLRSSCFEN